MDDGNLAVFEGLRVGRIVDDHIEWLEKKVPDTNAYYAVSYTHLTLPTSDLV